MVASTVAAAWVNRWDAQQERYVADREERFAVLCDIVESSLATVAAPVVLDLGCGPGSLAARLLARLPQARIIGLDYDPLLLSLARTHYGDTIEWVDTDLNGTEWPKHVPNTIHAAVSTTALHWMPGSRLAELYRGLATRMAPGGVLVNGDHLKNGDERIDALAETVRARRATRVGVDTNEEWWPWWDAILADPNFEHQAEVRARRVAERQKDDGHNGNELTVNDHTRLLRTAGFRSAAPVWQVGDDTVLVAVK
ncbi:class I SAM-dependent methyltransferase [Actinocrispum wychmicini]|uniref:Methyltransferase family protein n=1 Tax=Actinocrispum wychmicini TaxID=1213861 RepID=A0A4R2J940_9PSEU|nr:class I SAM-dependent methyltransferase [Actinocrispum wychmicini]TCO53156.1 methyltransferase family protein [Actinocrispum wychmicini]